MCILKHCTNVRNYLHYLVLLELNSRRLSSVFQVAHLNIRSEHISFKIMNTEAKSTLELPYIKWKFNFLKVYAISFPSV